MGLVVALMLHALRFVQIVRSAIIGVIGWITASTNHMLGFGLGCSLAAAAWSALGWHASVAAVGAARADARNWQQAATTMRHSYDQLSAATAAQNAAIAKLKSDSDTRRARAAEALVRAGDAISRDNAEAIAIASDHVTDDCHTSAAVLAARGEL